MFILLELFRFRQNIIAECKGSVEYVAIGQDCEGKCYPGVVLELFMVLLL